jgi:hypothetical protein
MCQTFDISTEILELPDPAQTGLVDRRDRGGDGVLREAGGAGWGCGGCGAGERERGRERREREREEERRRGGEEEHAKTYPDYQLIAKPSKTREPRRKRTDRDDVKYRKHSEFIIDGVHGRVHIARYHNQDPSLQT